MIPQFKFEDARDQKKFEKVAEVLKKNKCIIDHF